MVVPVEDVDPMWDASALFLRQALKTTDKLDEEDAKILCKEGNAQLWVFWSPNLIAADGMKGTMLGAAITEMCVYTNGRKVLEFMLMSGTDIALWSRTVLAQIEEFASMEMCDAVEFKGRQGFGRMFEDYKPTAWVYTKEL
jgi:hypothetical protein